MRSKLFILATYLLSLPAYAHPVPEVPVRAAFKFDRTATLQVEIDPRCFEEDAENAEYLKKHGLDKLSVAQREDLISQARTLVETTLRFHFEPEGVVDPEFTYRFVELADAIPDSDPGGGTAVMVVAEWKTELPENLSSYQLEAVERGRFSIYFINKIDDRDQKLNVLFPGETSYVLDLSTLGDADNNQAGPTDAANNRFDVFVELMRQGFVHVVPLGLDHILFVLGLFFLSREWRPLLLQVTTFTVAHTVTLGFATLGYVSAPSNIVEPLIAFSIAVVAIENIFRSEYTRWRLIVVFAFGLIHGLGFAALSNILGEGDLITGLLGFNVGVEFGQLAVISAAFLVTFYLAEKQHRMYVAVPGSIIIALIGLYWTFERVFVV